MIFAQRYRSQREALAYAACSDFAGRGASQVLFMCLLWSLLFAGGSILAADKPNILIVMADDCTYNDLPVYGGANAKTPNLDRFAAESLVFNKAYLCSAMCQPCRAELYTGQYPLRNGCAWNHSASRPDARSMPHHLNELGYRVGIAGKVHVQPAKAFPFENVPGFDSNAVRNPTQPHRLDGVRDFISRDTAQPFALVVALTEPHVPWVMGDASQYPPDQIKLPENIADTPKTRDDYAHYLAEMTYMDGQVGEILKTLEEAGQRDNTLVLFTSEQGSQYPGNKWTNYDTGVHTALIARWPGQIAAGRTDALVQYSDVLPTLVELAGGKPESGGFDGTSFAAVLAATVSSHRRFVFNAHNNYPEGPPYPIRSISNGEHHYILNLTPAEIYIEKHLMGIQGGGALNNAYWPTWVGAAENNPRTYQLVKRYILRPEEELYHMASDPYEIRNLIDDVSLGNVKQELRAELDRWLAAQGDPGIPLDTVEAHQAAKRGEHQYAPPK